MSKTREDVEREIQETLARARLSLDDLCSFLEQPIGPRQSLLALEYDLLLAMYRKIQSLQQLRQAILFADEVDRAIETLTPSHLRN